MIQLYLLIHHNPKLPTDLKTLKTKTSGNWGGNCTLFNRREAAKFRIVLIYKGFQNAYSI
jgi:hypothetical protein